MSQDPQEFCFVDAYDLKGGCGFTDGNGCSTGTSKPSLFGKGKKPLKMPEAMS